MNDDTPGRGDRQAILPVAGYAPSPVERALLEALEKTGRDVISGLSQAKLSRIIGQSRRQVVGAIRRLHAAGWLTWFRPERARCGYFLVHMPNEENDRE